MDSAKKLADYGSCVQGKHTIIRRTVPPYTVTCTFCDFRLEASDSESAEIAGRIHQFNVRKEEEKAGISPETIFDKEEILPAISTAACGIEYDEKTGEIKIE